MLCALRSLTVLWLALDLIVGSTPRNAVPLLIENRLPTKVVYCTSDISYRVVLIVLKPIAMFGQYSTFVILFLSLTDQISLPCPRRNFALGALLRLQYRGDSRKHMKRPEHTCLHMATTGNMKHNQRKYLSYA
eukprot:3616594-Amphidinium_carterae.1